jgi:hypothetical protein
VAEAAATEAIKSISRARKSLIEHHFMSDECNGLSVRPQDCESRSHDFRLKKKL